MGYLNLDRFIELVPDEITEDEKENLFPDICSAEVTADVDHELLLKMFRISQEVLKYKGEQVESLVSELDALAVRLGEEEAKQNQNFIEVEEFQHGEKNENVNAEDFNRKLMKIEIQKNRLIAVIQEKEAELVNEKKESENLSNRLFALEEENKNIKAELQSIQQELASSANLKFISDDQDYFSIDKYNELSELLRQKNKHITQLLNDIEDIERENIILRDKLSIVRDELQEGAEQMSKLSMERISLSTCVDELNGKVFRLEQENIGLRSQISELIIDKETRDKQFDNLSSGYESKIQQWKELLEIREMELSSAKYRQSSGNSNQKFDDSNNLALLSKLSKTLAEREEKIFELQNQLEQATTDLNENTRLLEEQKRLFQSKFDRNFESNNMKQLRKQLDQAENRILVLEAKAKYAEEESLRKAEEVTELILQLREYESGTYGLEDAKNKIKNLEKQKQIRDTQIEQLIQSLNELQDEENLLEHENHVLREKLGISPEEQIVTDDVSRRNLRKQNKVSILNQELDKNCNELVELKLENRKLNQQIASLIAELNFHRLKEPLSGETDDSSFLLDVDEYSGIKRSQALVTKSSAIAIQNGMDELFLDDNDDENKENVKALINENESLRKGMHEILESIRKQDGSSLIRVESETLERLLEALDMRHVSGWYQPAMRLQAHIHHLYGVNEALREELHTCRSLEDKSPFELRNTEVEQKSSQDTSLQFSSDFDRPLTQKRAKSAKLQKAVSLSEESLRARDIDKDLTQEREKRQKLELEIKKYTEKFVSLDEEMKKSREIYEQDKESWCGVKTTMQEEIDNLRNSEAILQIKINDFEQCIETIKSGPEQINKTLVEMSLSMSSLKVEHEQLTRKFQRLLEMENQIRQEKNKLSNEIHSLRYTKDQEMMGLRRKNEQISLELKELLSLSSESVTQQDYARVTKDFKELTVKYREIQQKQIFLQSQKEHLIAKLQNEIASTQSQKMELEFLMKKSMEEMEILRFSAAENNVSDEITAQAKQTAELELEVTNMKQQSQHWNRMYELTKEQLTEMENRCKQLEEQLLSSVQINAELQKNEASLKEEILKLPTASEYETLLKKFKESESTMAELKLRENELQELANIAQDQVKNIEYYNRYQDFEYDSLQRRILELQSLSDEKMIIDRLTKELLLLQQNGINANYETNSFKEKLAKSENEILQLKMKLNETESNYNKLKRDTNIKIKYMHAIIYELQKRYLGSYPLVKEELCVRSILNSKEECVMLMSVILDLKPPSIFLSQNEDTQKDNPVPKLRANLKKVSHRSEFTFEDFSLKLMNEGLQNKLQIYCERLGRQDKLICRLEEEIVHADEQCQEFLLYWNPNGDLKFINRIGENQKTRATQTRQIETKKNIEMHETRRSESPDKTNDTIQELEAKLQSSEEEVRNLREKLGNMALELKEKELIISNRDKEISLWQKIGSSREEDGEQSDNNENSIKKLALQATVDSLQNIINQKEEIITRQQNMLKKSGEEHAQNILELVREIKTLQNSMDLKQQALNRLKIKLEMNEKPPDEKRSIMDSYLTKIHELEDELNQANEKVEQLSNQLLTSNQQAELWSHTAEERLKSLQNMKIVMDNKPGDVSQDNKLSQISIKQSLKEKCDEIERLKQMIDEQKKQQETGKKVLTNRDRLKSELERYKKKVEILEQRGKEDKAEIQKLKNQILSRPNSVSKKEVILSPREEQLVKKIKSMEEDLSAFKEKEKKWKELRQTKVDEEIEKWQHKKQYQQNFEKLRQQLKGMSVQCESLTLTNSRLKETIVRLEKERLGLDGKLKAAKSQVGSISMMEELQKTNSRLEHEIEVLRRSAQFSMGTTSLTSVIEAQERKIKALELAQNGNNALAEEVERLNERKSQLQKYNVRLEEENVRLKLEIEKLKSESHNFGDLFDFSVQKTGDEDLSDQLKGNRRKNSNLERAVLVLRRLVEKLQAENRRLLHSRTSQAQDKNNVEKLNADLQNLHENYLAAIERTSSLDKELKTAYEKIDSLQKLIDRLQRGEEISVLKSQIAQKNLLLTKVKSLLEKAASREKELLLKVHDLQKMNELAY